MTFEPEISWKRTGVFVFFAIFEASNLGDTGWRISTSFPFSFNWLIKVLKLMGIWISESCQMIKRLSGQMYEKLHIVIELIPKPVFIFTYWNYSRLFSRSEALLVT